MSEPLKRAHAESSQAEAPPVKSAQTSAPDPIPAPSAATSGAPKPVSVGAPSVGSAESAAAMPTLAAESSEERLRMSRERTALPIYQYRDELLSLVKSNQVLICVGEPGSGKTTQIPQYLFESKQFSKTIAVTQPRRVAAITVAQRVSQERGTRLGDLVGYQVRFLDETSPETRIKYLTDGCLVRECLSDDMLSRYSVVILDEAHERSIHTDILFGLLKSILKRRRDLKLVITSATLLLEKFRHYYSWCPCLEIPGRLYPVDIYHNKKKTLSKTVNQMWSEGTDLALRIHREEEPGHILFFLTGQYEIENACSVLNKAIAEDPSLTSKMKLRVCPLYGALPTEIQQQVFDPVDISLVRKVVVATNIADTSLTVPGVRFIIDPGFVKQKQFNPDTGMDSLEIVRTSQTAAQQRAGRAGRTNSGKCYRLYPRAVFEQMTPDTIPEIQRTNLANTVLYLKALGIKDVLGFDYIDPPPRDSLINALKVLFALGALTEDGEITPTGTHMSEYPLEPCLAKTLVSSFAMHCSEEVTTIVSMLSVENIFMESRRGRDEEPTQQRRMMSEYMDPDGDHFMMLRIFSDFSRHHESLSWCRERGLHFRALRMASRIRQQLQQEVRTHGHSIESCGAHRSPVKRAFAEGFFMNIAREGVNGVYKTIVDVTYEVARVSRLDPASSLVELGLSPPFILFHELVSSSKSLMRHCMSIEESQFQTCIPKVREIDISRLCGHEIGVKEYSIGEKGNALLVEAPMIQPTSITEDALAAAKRRFLERQQQKQGKK